MFQDGTLSFVSFTSFCHAFAFRIQGQDSIQFDEICFYTHPTKSRASCPILRLLGHKKHFALLCSIKEHQRFACTKNEVVSTYWFKAHHIRIDQWLMLYNFRHYFTLLSEYFSPFLRSTCLLLVSHSYLALEEIYLPYSDCTTKQSYSDLKLRPQSRDSVRGFHPLRLAESKRVFSTRDSHPRLRSCSRPNTSHYGLLRFEMSSSLFTRRY